MQDRKIVLTECGHEAVGAIGRRAFVGACVTGSAALLAGCGQGNNIVTPKASNEISTTRQIGPDRRLAVRNECWYALDDQWQSNSNPTASDQEGPKSGLSVAGYGGNAYTAKANWAYIKTDANNNALRYVVSLYLGYASNIIPGTNGQLQGGDAVYWIGRMVNDDYALGKKSIGSAASKYPGYGHGLQCTGFVSMILYRALGGYQSVNMNAKRLSSNGPASSALPGDIVFNPYIGNGWGHVAICVRNSGGIVTIVDSNYVGGDGQEVIGKHNIASNDLGNWSLYSGKGRWY